MVSFILPGNSASSDYEVANSLRFDGASSAYLNRTHGSSGSTRTMTISFWVKKCELATNPDTMSDAQILFGGQQDSYPGFFIIFSHVGDFIWIRDASATNNIHLSVKSDFKFRDPSAWYHVVYEIDTTQGTASNRVKLYINGVQQTEFAGENATGGATDNPLYPDQNHDLQFNGNEAHYINKYATNYEDMYMAEFVFIDGTALDHTSFGEFDSNTNIWKPKDVSGLTFGTNGFYLDFEDSSSLGNDAAGSNNWTANNISSINQTTDTCTNNFATMNPLDLGATTSGEFLKGNLDVHMGGTAQGVYYSTIGVSSGKWVMEVNPDSGSGGNSYIGISGNANNSRGANDLLGDLAFDYGYYQSDGSVRNNDSDSSYGSSYSNGNIIGVYLDLDNNKLYFSINGTVQNSGTGISISDVSNTPTGFYFFCVGDDNAYAERRFNVNFGNPIETISSGNTDGEFGNFEYTTTITGDGVSKTFKALCTKNLAEYG